MQLSIEIDPTAPIPLQTQLVGEISTSITNGRLAPGTRLPGTRSLREQLGVSRNTARAKAQAAQDRAPTTGLLQF
jgi:GntR family transcriptional regulator/MocR family aminotransferase